MHACYVQRDDTLLGRWQVRFQHCRKDCLLGKEIELVGYHCEQSIYTWLLKEGLKNRQSSMGNTMDGGFEINPHNIAPNASA